MKLAGVIILYNPDEETIIENINSYVNDVDLLIAIDNSDEKGEYLGLVQFLQDKNAIYIKSNDNLGIAWALNIAATKAIEKGYQWLLTMDQDSKVTATMISQMANFIKLKSKDVNIGILSPNHILDINDNHQNRKNLYEENYTVMTSGNILNLSAYLHIGKFNENFFIDYVDHEFCLRLLKSGYKILTLNNAFLLHKLGDIKSTILGSCTNHNATRRYYITRNRLLVRKLYKKEFPEFCNHDFKSMWKELLLIFLFEKDKINKIKAFLIGVWHFRINRIGKL